MRMNDQPPSPSDVKFLVAFSDASVTARQLTEEEATIVFERHLLHKRIMRLYNASISVSVGGAGLLVGMLVGSFSYWTAYGCGIAAIVVSRWFFWRAKQLCKQEPFAPPPDPRDPPPFA